MTQIWPTFGRRFGPTGPQIWPHRAGHQALWGRRFGPTGRRKCQPQAQSDLRNHMKQLTINTMSYYVAESCGGAQHACPLTMKAIMKGREREGREREVQILILWLWGGMPFLKNTSTTHFKNCLTQTPPKRILRREIARTMRIHICRRTLINMWVIWADILSCCVEAAAMQGMPHERPNMA